MKKKTIAFLLSVACMALPMTANASDNGLSISINGSNYGNYYGPSVINYSSEIDTLSSAEMNGEPVANGTFLEKDGVYNITIKDNNGNTAGKTFTIDSTNPTVIGLDGNKVLDKKTTLYFVDNGSGIGKVIINGKEYGEISEYTFLESGNYNVTVFDKVGNQKSVSFVMDIEGPSIENLEDDAYYRNPVIINAKTVASLECIQVQYTSNSGKRKTYNVDSGYTLYKDGTYKVTIKNELGTKKVYDFTIDTVRPRFRYATKNHFYKKGRKIKIIDKNLDKIFINGVEVDNCFVLERTSVVEAFDKAGNGLKAIIGVKDDKVRLTGVNLDYFNKRNTMLSCVSKDPIRMVYINGQKVTGEEFSYGYDFEASGKYNVKVVTERKYIKKVKKDGKEVAKTFVKKKSYRKLLKVDVKRPSIKCVTSDGVTSVHITDDFSGVAEIYVDNEKVKCADFVLEKGNHFIAVYDKAGNKKTKYICVS